MIIQREIKSQPLNVPVIQTPGGLVGGPNPAPVDNVLDFIIAMSGVFSGQFDDALKRNIVNTMEFAWVASKEWADEIFRVTNDLIGVFITDGAGRASDIGVTLTDFVDRPHVQAAIRDQSFKFAQSVGESSADALRKTMLDGTAAGESIPQLTKRVQKVFGISDPDRAVNWRAERIARTESSRASHIGDKMAWRDSGIVEKIEWDASNDACPFCTEMHGKTVGISENFFEQGDALTVSFKDKPISLGFDYLPVEGPPLHPNSCAPETSIIAPDKVAATRAAYRGPIVQIRLSDGRELTVTPNHALLTPFGFMAAQFLMKGDDVLSCSDPERIFGKDPNNNYAPAEIADVVNSLSKSSRMPSMSVPATAKDLHGDGAFGYGNIDIVWSNRLLRNHPYCRIHSPDKIHQGEFISARSGSRFPGHSALTQFLMRTALASDSSMGSSRDALAFHLGRLRHPEEHGFAMSPQRDSKFMKPLRDQLVRTPQILGDFHNRFPGVVAPCKVTDIKIFPSPSGFHVYDIQTISSMYIVNGILSSNCRCTLVPVLLEIEM